MQNDNEVNTQGSGKMNNTGLPKREGWNVTDVMACGEDYSVDDAAVVMMDLWHEYADRFEAHLIELVEQTETTEIEEDDGSMLIRKFSNYPARPVLRPGFCMATQGSLLDQAWNQWAEHVEEIFTALRDSLARGKQTEGHQKSFSTVDDKAPGVQGLCMGMDHPPKSIALILRALLRMSGVDRGPSASKTGSDELAGIEKLCLESGTYSGSRGRMEELAIRLKLEQK